MYRFCDILGDFRTVGIEETDKVKLMNRKECKYVLSINDLGKLLAELHNEYSLVEINDKTIMPYKSVYYDLPDFALYRTHQNGKLNRFKVRSRTYVLTGTTFLEYKLKTNRKRTIKERIEVKEDYKFTDCEDFLSQRLPFSPSQLEEKLQVDYNRITLVDRAFSERVTIDANLHYSAALKESDFNDLVIIEIKREGNRKISPVKKLLQINRIQPFSISKYCLGISQLYSGVKTNLINTKIREINKMLNLRDVQPQKKII
ncbi:MAG: polyphosphate polymerase domain-containing protein [Spirochaetales bacterium]|uniref:Polyphosphate polymerase domain-containing protein n=1 Tax=Candidatus Thalassospirochaeta sargassi TaxID=3119039 RepID=A0AAJ1III4_9SPIO|nr:polyphosphate polymerase domain-containing protein [Spirochaetales bacterium]